MTLLYAIAAILVVVGLAGVVLPALPGLPLVFAGMVVAAWAEHFTRIGIGTLVALGVLTLLSLAVDFWAAALGAKRVGASRLAIAGAIAGTIAGLFFGFVGVFVGPFCGALLGELAHGRRLDPGAVGQATKVGVGTWLGIVLGVALKLMLALAMLALFAWAWWH
jgi:uncharacterized protein YqgC (DUF456 family)